MPKHKRRKPYTAKGIKRIPCKRCGLPSSRQFRICALGSWAGVCDACDLELNALVLKFLGVVDWRKIIAEHKQKERQSSNDL